VTMDIRKPLKKFLPHLLEAQTNHLNEADTVQRLIKVFEEVLGYDMLTDVSRETQLKNKYVDIALKVDGVTRLLVEAKAAGEKLRDRHIEQAQAYASRNNYRWVLLTNGVVWNLYHLTFEEGIEYDRAFSIDLSHAQSVDDAADKLALLHKQAVKKNELEHFWEKSSALNPATIGKTIFSESVIALIRREIRKERGILIDPEDLIVAIHGILSAEARELIGPAKLRKRRSRPAAPAVHGTRGMGDAEPTKAHQDRNPTERTSEGMGLNLPRELDSP